MAKSLGSAYVLHHALGRGAMGQVFAGSVRDSGQPVAVKLLRPELVSDPDVVARFIQERTILMSIHDPNVVRVMDLVVEGETLAIVMELVQGTDLRRHLRERHTLPLHGLAAALAARGIGTRMLGPALPADALAAAIRTLAPAAGVVWAQLPRHADPAVLGCVPGRRRTRLFLGGPGWRGLGLDPRLALADGIGPATDDVVGAVR